MINKIFKQRMDDPEPLEKVARGVPAAFAAIVRKLMTKKPEERYQTCAELRADLAAGPTPPGSRRSSAPRPRPPGPSTRPRPSSPTRTFASSRSRRLQPERALAPRPRRRRTVARPSPPHSPAPPSRLGPASSRGAAGRMSNDTRWLLHFTLIVLAVGLVAILAIALLVR